MLQSIADAFSLAGRFFTRGLGLAPEAVVAALANPEAVVAALATPEAVVAGLATPAAVAAALAPPAAVAAALAPAESVVGAVAPPEDILLAGFLEVLVTFPGFFTTLLEEDLESDVEVAAPPERLPVYAAAPA